MRKTPKSKLPPFVALTWQMLNASAYIELNHAAGKALPYFLGKAKYSYNDPQRYLTEFTFSYTEGKRYGFALSTFHKIIEELVKKGFIDPVDKGGLRSDGKSYNFFKLSKRWEKYGAKDFVCIEWHSFQPREKQRATPKRETNSSKKGNGIAANDQTISQNGAVGAISV